MTIRNDIVAEARTWLGTRWQHQGRVKRNENFHGGVDCLGLVLGVANALDLFNGFFTFHNYNRLPHDNLLMQECERYLIRKSINEALPGDVLAFRIQTEPQHLAILSEKQTIIHAYVQAKSVVENSFSPDWQSKLVAVFSYPSV